MFLQADARLRFQVAFDGQPDNSIDLAAYIFDQNGNFITRSSVDDGKIELAISAKKANHARLFIAPVLPERKQQMPTIQLMERLKAYNPVWNFDRQVQEYNLLPIPDFHWKDWLWRRCRVRGRVVKPVTISGISYDMPVCKARVHICEVDPLIYIIPRLPDYLVWRLRDDLIRFIERPTLQPIPEPDPPFSFDPSVVDPSPEAIAQLNRVVSPMQLNGMLSNSLLQVALNPQTLPPRAMVMADQTMSAKQSVLLQSQLGTSTKLLTLPVETRALLSSPSVSTVRQGLLANPNLLRPYLCYWDWLLSYLQCDEIAIVETDQQGRFDSAIWYLITGDRPDLYFWVEYCIGGTWTTVYRPSVRCNTYWDYACGTEVTIRITDPRVPYCSEPPSLPGLQVGVLTIGNNVSLHEIQGAAAGMVEGLTTASEPFGGSLEPHVWFGSDLLAAGISYYRWSYRRLGASEADWRAMDRQVVRHYSDIASDGTLVFKPYLLGPDTSPVLAGKNLFQIQPQDPPTGTWVPQVDARENTASAFFLSYLEAGADALAAAGKYELKLELFRNDGTLVNLTDAGVEFKVPTTDAPFGVDTVTTTAPAPERLFQDADGKVVAFRLVVHVDNNPCEAEIYTITGTGLTIDADCGFLEYAPAATVSVSFKARHPNNFAVFNFDITRGNSIGIPEASADGPVGNNPVDGFNRSAASVFSKNGISVATLLTSQNPPEKTPCTKAAFAQTLYVGAIATDGWLTLTYLSRPAIPKAFALAPHQ